MNFTPIDNKGLVEGYCIIKAAERKVSSKGDAYLDLTLADKEGEINAKLWRYTEAVHGEYNINDLVKVRGTISEYNGADQLRVERIRPVGSEDGVTIDDFVKTAGYSGEEMFEALFNLASSFEDKQLSSLVTSILSDHRLPLLYWPAAFKLHHAVRGGLLYHSLSIARLAERLCNIYTFVDRELLIAGAILHDIAKLSEFEVNETGLASGYTNEGNLLGHLTMGAMMVNEYAQKLNIDQKTAMLVEHMLISHHGEPEFGAAVRPMFIEAEILSELDLLDSRVYGMREAVLATKEDEFTSRLWALDNRRLYNHARADINKETKLF